MAYPSVHNALAADLAARINSFTVRPYVGALEVTVDTVNGLAGSSRFDVVGLDTESRCCTIFEVKTSRQDAQQWLRAERWKTFAKHGANPVLVYPESLGWIDLPSDVGRLRKLNTGAWEPIWVKNALEPSKELLIGIIRSLTARHRDQCLLGKPLVVSLLEAEAAE